MEGGSDEEETVTWIMMMDILLKKYCMNHTSTVGFNACNIQSHC